MTIDEQIARAKELIARREEIDQQLIELFAGGLPTKKASRCTRCGEAGHNAKTCPTKHAAESEPASSPL